MTEGKRSRGRPKSAERVLTNVRFDKRLAGMALAIAKGKGLSISEYLASACEPVISKDYAKLMRELEAKGS